MAITAIKGRKRKDSKKDSQVHLEKDPKERDLLSELNLANQEIAEQLIEKKKREDELAIAHIELVFQEHEKDMRAKELVVANSELAYQTSEKAKRAEELDIANKELEYQTSEKANRASELVLANKELEYQTLEKADRASELDIANKELEYQTSEKANRASELVIANKELAYQTSEKADRASELLVANIELAYQTSEKEERASELRIANKELAYQTSEKADRASELKLAKSELAYQTTEKADRASELKVANTELAYQTSEKADRATELKIANIELAYQTSEKANRASELKIANSELEYQTSEKADRASELKIANKELAYQTTEKADRASELKIANKELAYQTAEKQKRADEFIIINNTLINQYEKIENLTYRDQTTGLYNRKYFLKMLENYDHDENLPISVIVGDVNGLALINDSFGNAPVDEIMIKVSKLLKKFVRREDVIFRLNHGGFAIILPRTDYDTSSKIVHDLKLQASQEKVGHFDISISCGVQTKGSLKTKLKEIIQSAYEELITNKKAESTLVEHNTINLIMKMLFEKNSREMLHSARVGKICERIAQRMNLSQDVTNSIRMAGMLHDIGKIGIDEAILNKVGKLDDQEWKEVKKHTEIGYRILSASNEFANFAEDVLKHHERMDGKGYPKGIKGEDISLTSRIISIADTYDALTSDRPYRSALSEEVAIKEIVKSSGHQFDPAIVEIFVNLLQEQRI